MKPEKGETRDGDSESCGDRHRDRGCVAGEIHWWVGTNGSGKSTLLWIASRRLIKM